MSLLDKKTGREYDNASTQINVPPEIAAEIARIGKELIPDEHLAGDGRVEVLHVTVKYGVQPDQRTLRQAIAGYKSFEVSLGKTVVFPEASTEGTPVVIEVHGHEFEALHKAVAEAMGTLPDDFPYTPHITVAYVKQDEAQHYAGSDAFAGIEFVAEAVTLSMFDDDNQVDVPLKTAQLGDQHHYEDDIPTPLHTVSRRPAVIDAYSDMPDIAGQEPTLVEADPRDLVTDQTTVSKSHLDRILKDIDKINEPSKGTSEDHLPHPLVLGTSEGDFIFDGNHRCAAAMEAGVPIKVLYIDLTPVEDFVDEYEEDKTAASPAVMPEIPEIAPQHRKEEQPEEEEVERDEPATEEKRVQPKRPKAPLLQKSPKPKPYKAPKPPAQNKDFKKWFGNSKVVDGSGKPLVVYHGTTHDFTTFDPSKTTKDSHYGQGLYFTSSKKDLENYASDVGPDITRRVEGREEEIMRDWEDSWDDVKDGLGFGDIEVFPSYSDENRERVTEKAKAEAKKEIAGQSGGMSMPVYLSLQNPVIVQPKGGTYFSIEIDDDGNESGNGLEFYNAMMRAGSGYSGDPQEVWNEVAENMEFTAYDFEKQVRNGDHYFEDENGNIDVGSFIADTYREAGFDGIIQDAYAEFGPRPSGYAGGKIPGMGMDRDTKHYILWDPSKVKSAIGNVGKYDPANPSITAAAGKRIPVDDLPAETKSDLAEELAEHLNKIGFEPPWGGEVYASDIKADLFDLVDAPTVAVYDAPVETLYKTMDRKNSEAAVNKYTEMLRANPGFQFDPIFVVNGKFHDGGHRLEAYRRAGRKTVPVVEIGPVLNPSPEFWESYFAGDESAKIAAGEKSVGDLGLAKRVLHELMPLLGEQLPEPDLKIVNQPRAGWLGQDSWTVGINNSTLYGKDNTSILVQRSILKDENTLRRILAHELAHHADNLVNGPKLIEKFQGTGKVGYNMLMSELRRVAHGKGWKAYAEKFNAKYGADFVTEKSDETYVKEDLPVRPYIIAIWNHPSRGFYWATASRLGPKILKHLWQRRIQPYPNERVTTTDDRSLMRSATIGDGWSIPTGEAKEAQQKKLQELWDKADTEKPLELPNPWVKETKGGPVPDAKLLTKYLEQDGKEVMVKPSEHKDFKGWVDVWSRWKAASSKTADVPQLQELPHGVSKDYDRVRWVYQQFLDSRIQSMTWQDFQKKFPRERNSPLFTKVRQNRPKITTEDMERWMDEFDAKAKEYQNYEIEHGTYKDKATSFRDVEQLVLKINQSASAREIIGEDPTMKEFLSQIAQGSAQSGHPAGESTVGWLRVDFIDDDWLLVDEVQSDLVNAMELGKRFLTEPTLESLMSGYKSDTVKQKIRDMGANEQNFQMSKREMLRRGYTVEKLDEMKQQLINLFKDWAEYGIASLIEIARRHGIKNVAIHTGETIAKRDPDLEADKAVMYYDQLAKSFGFQKRQLDIGDLKGNFWVRTASDKTAGKRDEAVTSLTVGTTDPHFPMPVLIRWEQGMRWRQVLKTVKAIVSEIAGRRVPWREIHIWASLWDSRKAQDEGWEQEKGSKVMYDILHNGTFVSVGKPTASALGGEVIEASHKETPLSDTTFGEPELGTETNAYADMPEKVRGDEALPSLQELAPQMFEKEGAGKKYPEAAVRRIAEQWYKKNWRIVQQGWEDQESYEVGFTIYLDQSGKVQATKLAQGSAAEVEPPDPPEGCVALGSLHTHSIDGGEGLSEWDEEEGQRIANEQGSPYWMFVVGPAEDFLDESDIPSVNLTDALFEPEPQAKTGAKSLKAQLMALRPQMAAAAQEVYDAWDTGGYRTSEGGDVEFGEGGICDSIAREIGGIIASSIDCEVTDGGQDGDDHAWTIAYSPKEVFGIDIPHSIYERGGGYSWTKVPGVTFTADDVEIFPMDVDPSEFSKEGSAAENVEYRTTVLDARRDELFCMAEAWLNGERIGTVNFNVVDADVELEDTRYYEEKRDEYGAKYWERIAEIPQEAWVKMVWVEPEHRRKGIATGMYEKIKQDFPGVRITSSGTTPEGGKFREKLTERGVLSSRKSAAAQDLSSLVSYLTMSPRENGEELARSAGGMFHEYIESEHPEYSNLFDEEGFLDDYSPIPDKVLTDFLDKYGPEMQSLDPAYAPTFLTVEYKGMVKNAWLVHFTNQPDAIAKEGFRYGMDRIDNLALTTYFKDEAKKFGGYNFALDAGNRNLQGLGKNYGKHCVLFRANGVRTYHYGDEFEQIIFWGKDARDIIPIYDYQGYGTWSVGEDAEGNPLFESSDLKEVINWAIANKAKLVRKPKARAALLQKKAVYGEAQNQVQHTDHQAIGLTKTLKSNPFSEEIEALSESLGKDKPEPNPALDGGRNEGQPRAKGEDNLQTSMRMGKKFKKDRRDTVPGQVYLLHFDIKPGKKVKPEREDASKPFHARHYLGWAEDAQERIRQHYEGSGAKITQALKRKGITFTVARVWDGADRNFERRLKSQGGLSRHCPICHSLGLVPESRYRAPAMENVEAVPEKLKYGPDYVEKQAGKKFPPFEQWVKGHPQFDRVVNGEYQHDPTGDSTTPEELEERYLENTQWLSELTLPLTIYRALEIEKSDKEFDINFDRMGIYWTWVENSADTYFGSDSIWNPGTRPRLKNPELVIVKAVVTNPKDIDFDKTLKANMTDPEENEITLKPGARLKLVGMDWGEGYKSPKGQHTITAAASNSAEEAVAEIDATFPLNPLNNRENVVVVDGNPVAVVEVAERSGRLRLRGIRALQPGTGGGTLALKEITAIADRHGVEVELTASPFGGEKERMDKDKLQAWYRKHKFEDEPGYDPSLGYMVRQPKKVGAGAVNIDWDSGMFEHYKLTAEYSWHEAGDKTDEDEEIGESNWNMLVVSAFDTTKKQAGMPGKWVGSADFVMRGGRLESANTEVDKSYWRQGIATAMYQYAEGLTGFKIKPHLTQSDAGRSLWQQKNRPFGKDAAQRVSGEDVVSYVAKLNEWDRNTAYQVVGLDAGGDYVLRDFPLSRLTAGDDYDPEQAEQYSRMEGPFPPIVLGLASRAHRTEPVMTTYYVIRDGNHRVAAAKLRGDSKIKAYVPIDTTKTK